jgi:AbrB family looped-hinge helix DNA binding protein
MALMRVRRLAQLTLPAEVRRALNVQEGDYLEAKIVKDGVLLKPVAMVERKRAWQRIKKIASRVKERRRDPQEDVKAEEEKIRRGGEGVSSPTQACVRQCSTRQCL